MSKLEIREHDDVWAQVPATVVRRDPKVSRHFITIEFQEDWTGLNAEYRKGDKVSMPWENCRGWERFVVLRGIEEGNVFWSTMGPRETEEEVKYLADGSLAYEVLLVSESEESARRCWAERALYRLK